MAVSESSPPIVLPDLMLQEAVEGSAAADLPQDGSTKLVVALGIVVPDGRRRRGQTGG